MIRKVNKVKKDRILSFLYETRFGRFLLKPLVINSFFSNFVAWFLNRRISVLIIKPFIKKNKINTDDFEEKKYTSFNDFFIRKIKSEKRSIINNNNYFISPCDAKLMCYKINKELLFSVKNSTYSVESIIKDKKTSRKYLNGYALVFRLSPEDYHRYCFVDDGIIKKNYRIKGRFHTVNPIVYEKHMVFKENSRECTLINTKNFGNIMYVEVGALLVGKIKNHKTSGIVHKADEKGYFMYGGSTIVLLIEAGKIKIDEEILKNSENELETFVKYGEQIATKR